MEEHMKANMELWNELTLIHAKSAFYEVEKFKAGFSSLHPIEINELGDVTGKTMLHLQCHFGLDTLSWGLKGADVTGVDFSNKAIETAKALSSEVGINAEFICSNLYDLPKVLNRKFDIVFTSYGVLCWLPDLSGWAEMIATYLKKGGTFYIVEGHPFCQIFDNEKEMTELKASYSYFHQKDPIKWEAEGSYADKSALVLNPSYEWNHSLSDIINALIAEGLKIEFLHEFPYSCYEHFPFMQKGNDGYWRLNEGNAMIPMLFSLKATKQF